MSGGEIYVRLKLGMNGGEIYVRLKLEMSGGEIYVRLKLGMNGRLDLYSPKQPQSLQTGRLISAIGLFCYFVSSESGGRKKSR